MNENVKKLFDMVGGLAPTFALPLAIGLAAPAWVLLSIGAEQWGARCLIRCYDASRADRDSQVLQTSLLHHRVSCSNGLVVRPVRTCRYYSIKIVVSEKSAAKVLQICEKQAK